MNKVFRFKHNVWHLFQGVWIDWHKWQLLRVTKEDELTHGHDLQYYHEINPYITRTARIMR